MQILRSGFDLDRFFAHVSSDPRRTLLLDYDGTLAPFRAERSQATPYPRVRSALAAIMAADRTRLVVISGRAAHDLLPLLGLDRPPEIWGSHGWERRMPDGTYSMSVLEAPMLDGLARARAWLAARGWADSCEPKPAGLAIHWRGLEPRRAEGLREQALRHLTPLAQDAGLALHPFDGGIELRASGRDKGFAVRTILAEQGEGAPVAYLGDDLTDEDAFAALNGRGAGVLVRAVLRPTAAAVWLQPPHELLVFLVRWWQASAG